MITEFTLPTVDSLPSGITAGPDGNLYFAGSSPGSEIGRITTQGVITPISVASSGGTTAGPDGNIWLTEDGQIGPFVLAKPAALSTMRSASLATSASSVVSKTTAQGAAVDAAIAALSSGNVQSSAGPSAVVDPGTPIKAHKTVWALERFTIGWHTLEVLSRRTPPTPPS